ncbi:MAG: hypothetical protein JWO38_8152 [Gemmataceae bacterium]|nr:hypothetical protein [Gemmataceae bacterium]
MVATVRRNPTLDLAPEAEAFVAELARAAYEVALRHGITGPFADLELALWREVREVVREHESGMCPAAGGPA